MSIYRKEYRTVRLRLHPKTKSKNALLFGTADACRYAWNCVVAKLKDEYEWTGKCGYTYFTLGKWFTTLRNQNTWLQHYSANNVKASLKPIESTYKKFFTHKDAGLPKFKSRHHTIPSFPLADKDTFRVAGDSIYIQRIGWMRVKGSNPCSDCKPVSEQAKHEGGKWVVYLVYKVEVNPNQNTKIIGIDRNVGNIALSDNRIIELPKVESLVKKRTKYQRQMARRRKGSKRYLLSKKRAAKAYRKMSNIRLHWSHETSRLIANEYGTAVLEALKTKKMTRKGRRNLTRGILESCWGMLEQKLSYKMRVVKVNPKYTSQTCHACGAGGRRKGKKFTCLSGRVWHADINAAKNILARGVESLDVMSKVGRPESVNLNLNEVRLCLV